MSKHSRRGDPTERLSDQMKAILRRVYTYEPSEPIPASNDSMTRYVAEKFIPWRPSEFADGALTPSKRITLSNTLRRLEERGLLVRYSVSYKNGVVTRMAIVGNLNERARTTHIGGTRAGSLVALDMIDSSFDLDEYAGGEKRRRLNMRVEGLAFAFKLVERERFAQMAEHNEAAQKSLELINQHLEQMTEAEVVKKSRFAHSAVKEILAEAKKELKEG